MYQTITFFKKNSIFIPSKDLYKIVVGTNYVSFMYKCIYQYNSSKWFHLVNNYSLYKFDAFLVFIMVFKAIINGNIKSN